MATKHPKKTIVSSKNCFQTAINPKASQNGTYPKTQEQTWHRRNNSANVCSLLSGSSDEFLDLNSDDEQPRKLTIFSKSGPPPHEILINRCSDCYCKKFPVPPLLICNDRDDRCNCNYQKPKFNNYKVRSVFLRHSPRCRSPEVLNRYTNQRQNYENMSSNYFVDLKSQIAQLEDDMDLRTGVDFEPVGLNKEIEEPGAITDELLRFRRKHFFECHGNNVKDPIPKHICTHKFVLNDRLKMEAQNVDVLGHSRCTFCEKPISQESMPRNSPLTNLSNESAEKVLKKCYKLPRPKTPYSSCSTCNEKSGNYKCDDDFLCSKVDNESDFQCNCKLCCARKLKPKGCCKGCRCRENCDKKKVGGVSFRESLSDHQAGLKEKRWSITNSMDLVKGNFATSRSTLRVDKPKFRSKEGTKYGACRDKNNFEEQEEIILRDYDLTRLNTTEETFSSSAAQGSPARGNSNSARRKSSPAPGNLTNSNDFNSNSKNFGNYEEVIKDWSPARRNAVDFESAPKKPNEGTKKGKRSSISSPPRSPNSQRNPKKLTVYTGRENLEIEVPKDILDDKERLILNRRPKKAAPTNSLALRFQKGVY